MANLVLSEASVDQLDGAQSFGTGHTPRVIWVLLFLDAFLRLYRSSRDAGGFDLYLWVRRFVDVRLRFQILPATLIYVSIFYISSTK